MGAVVSANHAVISRLVNATGPSLITTLPGVWPEPVQLSWSLQRHGDCSWAKEEIETIDRRSTEMAHALLAAGVFCLIIAISLGCLSHGAYRLWWWSLRRQDLALLADL